MSGPQTILGGGLAGCCLAWEFWKRGADFVLIDRGTGGSSRVAAGMINPVTGKNFEPSWRITEFLPVALGFYGRVEMTLGRQLWHPLPVLRLAAADKEWAKISSKLDGNPWVAGVVEPPPGWAGAVEVRGGGRLDVRAFVEGTREFFEKVGRFVAREFPAGNGGIQCDGAAGLMTGRYGEHRCAKGEILTLRAPDWDESQIRIGAGGWLVPVGGGVFKAGSTYEWNDLDDRPTPAARKKVAEIARRLGGADFAIVDHEAGIRPILRRSEPLIGPLDGGGWMFNALGSKGSLYAPGMAARLADWILDGSEPEPEVDFRMFAEKMKASGIRRMER